MKALFLIYINYIGKDYKGNHIYEFIFSDTKENIDAENWDVYPASGRPEPPNEIHVKSVGRLESILKLDVIQNSDTFAVWDAVDGVIALAWENIDSYDVYPEHRISFRFGITKEEVEAELFERNLVLDFNIHKK
jgi:hypothetical protein